MVVIIIVKIMIKLRKIIYNVSYIILKFIMVLIFW